MGEYQITVDCDVLQADGGTRTAAISGACVAVVDAFTSMQREGLITESPLRQMVAAISVGVVEGQTVLDLDYLEDSGAGTDMNIVMTERGEFIELQGTAEDGPFNHNDLDAMLALGRHGIEQLIEAQKAALAE